MADPIRKLSAIKATVTRTTHGLEDAEMDARRRQLLMKAIDEAEWIIDHGPPNDRNAMIRALVAPMARMAGSEERVSVEETRMAVGRIFASMAHVEGADDYAPPTEISARATEIDPAAAQHDVGADDDPARPEIDPWE